MLSGNSTTFKNWETERRDHEEERKRVEIEKEQEKQKRMEEIRQKDEANRLKREEEWKQRDMDYGAILPFNFLRGCCLLIYKPIDAFLFTSLRDAE